jgi:hypothetical protein
MDYNFVGQRITGGIVKKINSHSGEVVKLKLFKC